MLFENRACNKPTRVKRGDSATFGGAQAAPLTTHIVMPLAVTRRIEVLIKLIKALVHTGTLTGVFAIMASITIALVSLCSLLCAQRSFAVSSVQKLRL